MNFVSISVMEGLGIHGFGSQIRLGGGNCTVWSLNPSSFYDTSLFSPLRADKDT